LKTGDKEILIDNLYQGCSFGSYHATLDEDSAAAKKGFAFTMKAKGSCTLMLLSKD
jgi:hypothetical protein